MAKKKNKKVVRYRRPLNINVGMIIFFIIFIYLVFRENVLLWEAVFILWTRLGTWRRC